MTHEPTASRVLPMGPGVASADAPHALPEPPRAAHAGHAVPGAASDLPHWGEDVKRILCVRLDNLGDVLMTEPAMRALRDTLPGRHLTLLASPSGAAVAPLLPALDDVIVFDAPWVKNALPADADATQSLGRRLAEARFDAAVIFTVYSQSPLPAAMLCHLAGIPRRLAYCRENPYALLTHWARETEPQDGVRHEVQRQLDLVARVGACATDTRMRMRVSPQDRAMVALRLARLDLTPTARVEAPAHRSVGERPEARDEASPAAPGDARWIVIHPGASAPSRRYPAERFATVAAALARATGYHVLLTGTPDEAALAQDVLDAARTAAGSAAPRIVSLAGTLPLGEFAALLDGAAVLVSNNSGPVHLAAALGTPVVDLYALTNPQHMPWRTPHRVLFHDVPCRWCYKSVCPQGHHACLRGVEAEAVTAAALDLLGHTGHTGHEGHEGRAATAQAPPARRPAA